MYISSISAQRAGACSRASEPEVDAALEPDLALAHSRGTSGLSLIAHALTLFDLSRAPWAVLFPAKIIAPPPHLSSASSAKTERIPSQGRIGG